MKTFDSTFSRLRFISALSGLTRNEITAKYNIPEVTLRRWETGSIPLTKKGARRCIDMYKQEGIIATESWIFTGEGARPFIALDFDSQHKNHSKIVDYFHQSLNNCVVYKIPDNSMLPKYSMNELVIGDVFIGDISRMHNRDCIVFLDNEKLLLRKLIYTDEDNVSLICTNTTSTKNAVLHNMEMKYIAPVLWHQVGD